MRVVGLIKNEKDLASIFETWTIPDIHAKLKELAVCGAFNLMQN
jgi:hypothetical protein